MANNTAAIRPGSDVTLSCDQALPRCQPERLGLLPPCLSTALPPLRGHPCSSGRSNRKGRPVHSARGVRYSLGQPSQGRDAKELSTGPSSSTSPDVDQRVGVCSEIRSASDTLSKHWPGDRTGKTKKEEEWSYQVFNDIWIGF